MAMTTITGLTLLHRNIGIEVHKANAYRVTHSYALVPPCQPYPSRCKLRRQYHTTPHDGLSQKKSGY